MPRPSEDDREAIDRAFAEMIAGYHLTAERDEPIADRTAPEEPATASPAAPAPPAPRPSVHGANDPPDPGWADEHPLFSYPITPDESAKSKEPVQQDPVESFVPEPVPPLTRPAWPVLLGWIGMGYAVLTMLVVLVGVRPPSWVGWLAVGGFVGGFGILVARLPRNRPPDAGDGAVL
ncbi:hypothetical protein GCM10009841_16050 [Microlunatus panaciterrae]|uniref:DUF2530 domain-containing protein n=1 Tax=Microlunatus panaciterrae TaxID=400768 RepID=A0ABS2RND2_9ACTN|nr:hypothetical protein [Microlunatus panaciterrae]MBM7800163.1 hypothetical protein [Microlunatus panaciterrae]